MSADRFRRIAPAAALVPHALYRRDMGTAKPLIFTLEGDPLAFDGRPDNAVFIRRDLVKRWLRPPPPQRRTVDPRPGFPRRVGRWLRGGWLSVWRWVRAMPVDWGKR